MIVDTEMMSDYIQGASNDDDCHSFTAYSPNESDSNSDIESEMEHDFGTYNQDSDDHKDNGGHGIKLKTLAVGKSQS